MAFTYSTFFKRIVNSVGNVTFQTYNNKVIMRQKPTSVANPQSPGQIAVRNKFTGCSEAYQVLNEWFSKAKYYGSYRQQLRLKFFKLTVEFYSTTGYGNVWEAASALSGYNFGRSGFCNVLKTDFSGSLPEVKIQASPDKWDNSLFVRYVTFNSVSQQIVIKEEPVLQSFWNNQSIPLVDAGVPLEVFGVYIYSLRTYKCSNFSFIYTT